MKYIFIILTTLTQLSTAALLTSCDFGDTPVLDSDVESNGSGSNTDEKNDHNDKNNVHEYITIGGIKWSTMNLGASTIASSYTTCLGDYYAWGETEPRYVNITRKAGAGPNYASFESWKNEHLQGYAETDYPNFTGTTLDEAHDAATQAWGNGWRTPTKSDFESLVLACGSSCFSEQALQSLSSSSPAGGIYWISATQSYISEYTGVAGILFIDKTDTSKRVFFPAAGRMDDTAIGGGYRSGNYWSSSLDTSITHYGYFLYFDSSQCNPSSFNLRCRGFSIRPVSD